MCALSGPFCLGFGEAIHAWDGADGCGSSAFDRAALEIASGASRTHFEKVIDASIQGLVTKSSEI